MTTYLLLRTIGQVLSCHVTCRKALMHLKYGGKTMPQFKCVHFFKDEDTGLGWSEVWYLTAGNFDQAVAQGQQIGQSRIAILANTNQLTYQRITGNQPATDAPRTRQPRASVLNLLELTGTAKAG